MGEQLGSRHDTTFREREKKKKKRGRERWRLLNYRRGESNMSAAPLSCAVVYGAVGTRRLPPNASVNYELGQTRRTRTNPWFSSQTWRYALSSRFHCHCESESLMGSTHSLPCPIAQLQCGLWIKLPVQSLSFTVASGVNWWPPDEVEELLL